MPGRSSVGAMFVLSRSRQTVISPPESALTPSMHAAGVTGAFTGYKWRPLNNRDRGLAGSFHNHQKLVVYYEV